MNPSSADPPHRSPGPFYLDLRDIAALRMLVEYQGTAHDGVRSVVARMRSDHARAIAAELLGWPAADTDAAALLQVRADAAWFRTDAAAYKPRNWMRVPSRAGSVAGERRPAPRRPKSPPRD